jgi:hypothetical protein
MSEVRVVFRIGSVSHEGTTDTEGNCRMVGPNLLDACVTVQKEGWCPMKWDLAENPPEHSTVCSFKMRRAARIGGLVVDRAGKAISGAQVFINFPQQLWGAHIPVEDFTVTTDAKGQWSTGLVPNDVGYIHLDVIQPSYAWDGSQPSQEKLMEEHAVITMDEILALHGRVLDPAGQAVSGATVFRGEQWGIMGFGSGNMVTADTNGWFRFPAEKSGKMQLAAFAPGFGPVIKDVELVPNLPPIELSLTTPHIRRIRVTDLNGNPLSNLQVRISGWRTFQYPPWEFTTDMSGRIVITNAPDDEFQMDFLAPHRMGLRFYRVAASEGEQIVQLGPELRLHGKVVDAATGMPVRSFQVIAGWPRQVFVNGQLTNQGAEWGNDNRKKSFRGGVYDWTFEEPVLGGTDKPYDFLLRVDAEGYAPAVSRAFKAAEKDAEFDFQLAAPAYIDGTIHFADGSPAAGAKIYLVNQPWDLNAENGRIQNMRNLPALTSDAAGRFKLMEQQAPQMLVVWHEDGFATVDFTEFKTTNRITLTKWGGIEGTLRRGSHPAAHETVALSFEPEWRQVYGQSMTARPKLFYNYETTTDDDGHFVFDKVPPGAAAITRVESISRPPRYGLQFGDVWAGCRLLVVDVPEGQTVSVKAGGIGRTVSGRFNSTNDFLKCLATLTRLLPPVPYPDGLDAAAKDVWAAGWFWSDAAEPYRIWLGGPPQSEAPKFSRPTGHTWAVKVATDGTFEISDVPAGTYALEANFMSPPQTGFFPMNGSRMGSESDRLTCNFTVLPGDNLPVLPPQDLGIIGDTLKEVEFPVTEPSPHEPVTFAIKTDPAEVKPGDTFQVLVRVRIAKGHHIYAAVPKSKAFTGTSISLRLPPGVEAISDWSEPAAVRAQDGELVYTNSILYGRSFKLSPTAVGPVWLKGEVHYQACNDQLCWPPKTLTFSAPLSIRQPPNGTP